MTWRCISQSQSATDCGLVCWRGRYGQIWTWASPQSGRIPVLVTGVTESAIRLDANHPLARKTLVFDIEVAETTHHTETPQEDIEQHAQDKNPQSNSETLPDHTPRQGQEAQAR